MQIYRKEQKVGDIELPELYRFSNDFKFWKYNLPRKEYKDISGLIRDLKSQSPYTEQLIKDFVTHKYLALQVASDKSNIKELTPSKAVNIAKRKLPLTIRDKDIEITFEPDELDKNDLYWSTQGLVKKK